MGFELDHYYQLVDPTNAVIFIQSMRQEFIPDDSNQYLIIIASGPKITCFRISRFFVGYNETSRVK